MKNTREVLEEGQTIECVNGTKVWYLNGKHHRKDGPAVEHDNGDKYWCINDQLHREDGPAIEKANGSKEWYIAGKKLNEKEFLKFLKNKTKKEIRFEY